jgi:hypothetical protein
MIQFQSANHTWWNKPLVIFDGRILPAELAILKLITKPGEHGAWMNSRGIRTGVVGFDSNARRTIRTRLPNEVSEVLRELYQRSGLANGCPDLITWSIDSRFERFVEVKCPHWDQVSAAQTAFMKAADEGGYPTTIVEWEFLPIA